MSFTHKASSAADSYDGERVSFFLRYYIVPQGVSLFCGPCGHGIRIFGAAMPKMVNKAKVACLDFSLQKAKMKLGVSVVIDDPAKLAAIRNR